MKGCVDQIFFLKQLCQKTQKVCFIDLEVYDREAICKVLKMFDVDGKLLNEIMGKLIV